MAPLRIVQSAVVAALLTLAVFFITPASPGVGTERVSLYTTASQSCGGTPCIWADSAIGKIKFRTAAGVDFLQGQADRITVAASDPMTPVFGQCYANSVTQKVRCYQNAAWVNWGDGGTAAVVSFTVVQTALAAATSAVSFNSQKLTNVANPTSAQDAATKNYVDTLDALVVHKAGTETVSGAKTFSSSVTLTGGATLGANLAGGGFKGTGFAQGTSSGELLHAGRQVLTTAPLTGGGALTGDLTLGLALSSSLTVAGGSLTIATGYSVHARVNGGGTGALGAATVYLTSPGQAASATERPLSLATRAGNLRNLYCDLGTAPGGADTVIVTARIAGADSALTCTISAAATSCSDTSNTPAVTAGQRTSIKAVSSAGTAADITCSLEQTN